MSQFSEFIVDVLSDRRIGDVEVTQIRDLIDEDGRLDSGDVKLLVELYCTAEAFVPAFEDLFFDTLERVFLADGQVDPSEQYYLLKMIYSDRQIRPRERDFLRRLQKSSTRHSPEFNALCQEALASPDRNWSSGGHPTTTLKL